MAAGKKILCKLRLVLAAPCPAVAPLVKLIATAAPFISLSEKFCVRLIFDANEFMTVILRALAAVAVARLIFAPG